MAKETELLKQIHAFKESLTFDYDKKAFEHLEQQVQKAVVRKDLLGMDGMKELLALMELKIKGCDVELLNNRDLTDDERKRVFDRRDIWKWFVNFFKESQRVVESAKKTIQKELGK